MQHHSFGHGAPGSVCGLRIDVAAKGPVTLGPFVRRNAQTDRERSQHTVAWSPGRSNGAVGVLVERLQGHQALE